MSFKCGIVGLPNVGKSTLFNALTDSSKAQAANFPFCTIDPNVGIVPVPDERLNNLAKISKSKKIINTTISFVDIAGLVKGASKGEGLGNKFLSHIREVDAIIHMIRCFDSDDIQNVNPTVDPVRDLEIIETEMMLADLESIQKRLEKNNKKNVDQEQLRILEIAQDCINDNKDLSVCPLTTHLPIKLVTKKINQKLIKEKTILINNFYIRNIGFKPKIAVTGLNPHCESVLRLSEEKKIILPAIKSLKKKGFKISGPFPADTIFLKQNRKKYDVILGMYHDQVLSPIKTLKEYDAINITLGLPFLRVSPDHGPNIKMLNKNISNPTSLIQAIKFLDKR